jgi:hypothetical protein
LLGVTLGVNVTFEAFHLKGLIEAEFDRGHRLITMGRLESYGCC